MDTSWSLRDLRLHIETEGVAVDHRLAVLESIERYISIFRYHFTSARDAMIGLIDTEDPSGIKNISFIFGQNERQKDYAHARIASEAHILGSIHSVRAVWDVFAFLVNDLAVPNKIDERRCDLFRVWQSLPDSPLKNDIGHLLESHWFKYISAFINTSKHRYLVPHAFAVCFESENTGIRVEGFEYQGKSFSAYWAQDLLKGVLAVENRISHCGQVLNWQLIGEKT